MQRMEQVSEFKEKLVAVNRVTKVVKGGRNFRFSALVVDELLRKKTKGRLQKQPKDTPVNPKENEKHKAEKKKRHFIF